MRRLEIGPGDRPLPGFETLDVVDRPGLSHRAKWGFERLPFDERSFDLVYASHVLEHVPWTHVANALSEARRILKPGGVLEVWVPNFAFIVDAYLKKRCGDGWRRFNKEGHFMKWVNGRIFTYGPGEENFHRAAFDPPWLEECLRRAGFADIQPLTKPRGADHGPMNLGRSGRKP